LTRTGGPSRCRPWASCDRRARAGECAEYASTDEGTRPCRFSVVRRPQGIYPRARICGVGLSGAAGPAAP
jgi:hypothetical protein